MRSRRENIAFKLVLFFAALFICLLILKKTGLINQSNAYHYITGITINLINQNDEIFDIYYDIGEGYNLDDIVTKPIEGSEQVHSLNIDFPDNSTVRNFRVDIKGADTRIKIRNIVIKTGTNEVVLEPEDILRVFERRNHITEFNLIDGFLVVKTSGIDPYFSSMEELPKMIRKSGWDNTTIFAILMSILISLFVVLTIQFYKNNKTDKSKSGKPGFFHQVTFQSGVHFMVFILMICIPILNYYLEFEPMIESTEKRKLSDKPELRIDNLNNYPKKYSDYFDDNFGFRNTLVYLNSYYKIKFFNTSPLPDNVITGKDGWLYYVAEGVDKDYFRTNLFTEKELQKLLQNLIERQEWLNKQGIEYYILIPPLKHTIYPEYYPDARKPLNEPSRLTQMIRFLQANSNLKIIDLREVIRNHKGKHRLYYKTDSHWNMYGAFIGYRELMKKLQKDLDPEALKLEDMNLNYQISNEGDLAFILAINNILKRDEVVLTPKTGFKAKQVSDKEFPTHLLEKPPVILENTNIPDAPRMLMFRDSYANYLIPFLSEHFERSTYIWTPHFVAKAIKYEKPDIVIHEVMERFIYDLLLENPDIVNQELDSNHFK